MGVPGEIQASGTRVALRFFGIYAIEPVDKQGISAKLKPIAVEAFGRHLKRVDASALFLF